MNLNLTRDEWFLILDALRVSPNPENYDFGPGYEFSKKARNELFTKIHSMLSETKEQKK